MAEIQIFMTAELMRRYKARHKGRPLVCHFCGKPLEVNSTVVRKQSTHYARFYHKECWEKLQH